MLTLFSSNIYLQIYKNRFSLYHLESGTKLEVTANDPFSTTRLLIGNFDVAVELLKEGIKKLKLKYPPIILVHPKEITEGGISGVENRIFIEFAICAGARSVTIHTGKELDENEIRNILKKT